MKGTTVLILVLASCAAYAQKGTQAEQGACYRQAREYVADQNRNDQMHLWVFDQVHYDEKAKVCYVEFSTSDGSSRGPIADHWFSLTHNVDDAYEGKNIASCGMTVYGGEITYSGLCNVNGKSAKTMQEWSNLLWKLIPAFGPSGMALH